MFALPAQPSPPPHALFYNVNRLCKKLRKKQEQTCHSQPTELLIYRNKIHPGECIPLCQPHPRNLHLLNIIGKINLIPDTCPEHSMTNDVLQVVTPGQCITEPRSCSRVLHTSSNVHTSKCSLPDDLASAPRVLAFLSPRGPSAPAESCNLLFWWLAAPLCVVAKCCPMGVVSAHSPPACSASTFPHVLTLSSSQNEEVPFDTTGQLKCEVEAIRIVT